MNTYTTKATYSYSNSSDLKTIEAHLNTLENRLTYYIQAYDLRLGRLETVIKEYEGRIKQLRNEV